MTVATPSPTSIGPSAPFQNPMQKPLKNNQSNSSHVPLSLSALFANIKKNNTKRLAAASSVHTITTLTL
ncbi:hypothetical protein BFJ69_g3428 [Fusarium oxysporum]|uniref:Uncharacterized protein n=1 Tax=Fusarium oxysporum TaxID=5507 RepID=A0A420NNH4_FUSOX|nr:hypothetical protein BFJ69_g3428 [Fusarium oxysporum]